jgi:hypothetical protein
VPFALFTGGYRKGTVEDFAHAHPFDHHLALPALAEGLI